MVIVVICGNCERWTPSPLDTQSRLSAWEDTQTHCVASPWCLPGLVWGCQVCLHAHSGTFIYIHSNRAAVRRLKAGLHTYGIWRFNQNRWLVSFSVKGSSLAACVSHDLKPGNAGLDGSPPLSHCRLLFVVSPVTSSPFIFPSSSFPFFLLRVFEDSARTALKCFQKTQGVCRIQSDALPTVPHPPSSSSSHPTATTTKHSGH